MKKSDSVRVIMLVSVLSCILFIKCDKDANEQPSYYDPCKTMSSMTIHCIALSPQNGAAVNPARTVLSWVATASSPRYFLFLGTSPDNMQQIAIPTTGSYELKDLKPGTTYYWTFHAFNACGRGCSSVASTFITVPDTILPYVTTFPVLLHESFPPRIGGNVMYKGSSEVRERGVFISSSTPSEKNGVKFKMEKGDGVFSGLVPDLKPNTTYYVKAYASNNSGTSYGEEINFIAGDTSSYKKVKDYDGNTYYSVNIGTQTWLSENLRTTRFNDGTEIPNIVVHSEWSTTTAPGYCWYENNPGYGTTYGALYNWYTVDTTSNGKRNVCPDGWHVPDKEEFATLLSYLGNIGDAAAVLKETGNSFWNCNNLTGNNDVGFSALPAGKRYGYAGSTSASSGFSLIRGHTEWWSSSASQDYFYLWCSGAVIYKGEWKNAGISVRCIKNTK